jgi:primosomal protein N' (replication factor Y)
MRVDRDSVRPLGGFEQAVQRIERGDVDIVVGTQMVAKGLDFPRISTVGVIQADAGLHLPDYRAAERTFQLIAQVAGRAGRRGLNSAVIVQTFTPEHYAITAAAAHSYEDFYIEEIGFRRQFRYPPFSRLVRFVIRSTSEETCRTEGADLATELANHASRHGIDVTLLGPAPAFVARIRGEYQWQVLIRTRPTDLSRFLDGMPVRAGWLVDVDPSHMI